MVMEGFSSSRTTSSWSCHDCFRELDPDEVTGLWKRILVDAEDTVEEDTELCRRDEMLSHSKSGETGKGFMMQFTREAQRSAFGETTGADP